MQTPIQSQMTKPIFEFHRGPLPLFISVPHAGTEVPHELQHRFTSVGQRLPDTDWHVDRLYDFARDMGASIMIANYSRYVVDLNRGPDSAPLYDTSPTSPVCAAVTFAGESIYQSDQTPTPEEVRHRVKTYWIPYHAQIEAELQRIKAQFGYALLWDAHSVASEVPGLFAGVLPEFNFGTRDGQSCPKHIAEALLQVVTEDGELGAVLDGRFKGGYITQHYGRPAQRIFAVQLELAQRAYLNESVHPDWRPDRAHRAQELIARLLGKFLKLGES
jgi:N-formylglutamate deformylase